MSATLTPSWRGERIRDRAIALWRHPTSASYRTRTAYLARVLVATAIALWLAAWLQLPGPQSAVTTVLIVSNPTIGAIVSKSVWRIVGTIFGAVVVVSAYALFGQTPWLFFIGTALWVGLCCFASTLLRYFRAYGAVLAGYTLVIVAVPTFSHPDQVLLNALSRLSVVVIGIVITGAVFLLTTPRPKPGPVLTRVRQLAAQAASLLELAATVPQDPTAWRVRLIQQRQGVSAALAAVDEQLEFLPASDPRIAATLTRLRLSCARLIGMLSGMGPLSRMSAWLAPFQSIPLEERPLVARVEQEALDGMRSALTVVADPSSDAAMARTAIAQVRHDLDHYSAVLSASAAHPIYSSDEDYDSATTASDLRGLALIDLIGLLLGLIEDVLDTLAEAASPSSAPVGPSPRLRSFYDWQTAMRNGVRGALAALIGYGWWYVTEWPEGPNMMAYVVPAASLLAAAPSAGAASKQFASGTALSAIASVVAATFLLPEAIGFWQVWLSIAVLIAPMLWLQLSPRWGRVSTGYMIFLSSQLGVQNPLHLDIANTLNVALAFLLGSVAVVLVFRILLPPNDLREARRLTRTLVRSVEKCARPLSWWARWKDHGYNRGAIWEHWHTQVVGRLIQRSASLPIKLRGDLVEGAMSSVILGRAILRLHDLDEHVPAGRREAIERVLEALRSLGSDPLACARQARSGSQAIPASLEASSDESTSLEGEVPTTYRVAATLRQIGDVLGSYPNFYDRFSPLQGLFAEPDRLRLAHMLPAERVS